MRGLVAAIAVVLVLAVAADAVATWAFERSAAEQAAETLDAPVEVDLQGWPVSVRAAAGSVPRATLTATDVPLTEAGARMTRVQATLTDVDPRGAEDALRVGELPPATGGSWTAELAETDLRAALPDLGELRFTDTGLRVTLGGVELEATVTAEDGRLVVAPQAPLLDWARLELGFAELPGEPTVEAVGVTPEALRIEGRLHPPPRRSG